MEKTGLNRTFIIIMLGLLMASAFFIRLQNFENSKVRSIDEVVYAKMARQVQEGLEYYNTIPYGKDLASRGRDLPDYFFQPLFKHPPLFTFLNAYVMKLFGNSVDSAVYVSLLFGILFIPLTYLLGKTLFNHKVGMLSAVFVWLDPVIIMSSQKVWMDTTLSFFIVLSIYLFIAGLIKEKDSLFILSGISSGLAVLTKYPGILGTVIVALYAAIAYKDLYRNWKFLFSLALPFIMLIPWIIWNYYVYGAGLFSEQMRIHNIFRGEGLPVRTIFLSIMFILVLVFIARALMKEKKPEFNFNENINVSENFDIIGMLVILGGIAFLYFIGIHVLRALNFYYLPQVSWARALFPNNSPVFYFGRLIEYNVIFLLSFMAFFVKRDVNFENKFILFISAVVVLLFFMVWGSVQSRYIMAAIPFLIVLGVQFWMELFEASSKNKHSVLGKFLQVLLISLLFYAAAKTSYIDQVLSFTNDMCYF